MKLIPESLEESQNFERGMDPKISMDIGLHRPLKPGDRVKILSRMDLKPFDTGEVLRIQKDGNIVVQSDWKNQRQGEIVLEPKYLIRESQEFQRGQDPKTSMEIGDAAILPELIDSNILQAVSLFDSYSEEELKDLSTMLVGDEKDNNVEEENYQLVKRAKNFLKGKAIFGKSFDWKEEDSMKEYISKYARGRYVYNATPGMDSWEVVFSKIYLPRAEAIEI